MYWNETANVLVKTQAAMNLKELGFSPELAFAKSGVSNDPVADVANSEKYIKAKWGSQDNTKVIGRIPHRRGWDRLIGRETKNPKLAEMPG